MAALLWSAVREAKEWNFTTVATWDTSPDVRDALETLAQANVFTKSVSEQHGKQRISLRWRDGEEEAGDIMVDNEACAWNSRT